jgi:tetratricopeptide (TPR) repeat protein
MTYQNPLIKALIRPRLDAAITLHNIGDHKEALQLVKKALKYSPKEIEAIIMAGLICQNLQDVEAAEKYFRRALIIDPKNPNALKSWGLFLLAQQRKIEALGILTQYLDLNKWDDQEILDTAVDLAIELGHEEQGLEILKDAWEHSLNPRIGEKYCIRLRLSDQIHEALSILQMLAKAAPEPSILNQLAITLKSDGQYEQANQVYQQAIGLENELIGKIDQDLDLNKKKYENDEILLGDFEGSYHGLHSSFDDANYLLIFLWCNLSDCYLSSGRKNEALEAVEYAESCIERWGNMEPGVGWDESLFYIMKTRVYALISLEKYQEAARVANEYLEENDPDEDDLLSLYQILAYVLVKGQHKAEGIDLLKRALEKFPQESEFYYRLADLLSGLGRSVEAVEILENAFKDLPEVDPAPSETRDYEYWEYRAKLAILLHSIGRGETAWEKVSVYFERKSDDSYTLMMDYLYRHLWDEEDPEYQPAVLLIKQLFSQLPCHPAVVWLMSTYYFIQNDLQAAVTVLENTQQLQSTNDSLKLILLNNLGYCYLLQGKLEFAQKVLEQALVIDNVGTFILDGFWGRLGVVFYFDGTFITSNQFQRSALMIEPSCVPTWSIMAVIYNLVALALARGDADQATALLTENIITYGNNEMDWEQNYLTLLSLARYRNDLKTAQVAWKMKLVKEGHDESFREERLKIVLPQVYAWLLPEGEDKRVG